MVTGNVRQVIGLNICSIDCRLQFVYKCNFLYVSQISLIPDGPEKTFCRTTLMKNDNNPWFDQKFSFEFLSGDLHKRLILSVWNRDTNKK